MNTLEVVHSFEQKARLQPPPLPPRSSKPVWLSQGSHKFLLTSHRPWSGFIRRRSTLQ
jgi:hypothetical protein